MPPEENYRPQPQRTQNPLIIPLSIVLAGAFIGGGIYLSSKTNGNSVLSNSQNRNAVEEISVNPVSSQDHILGNPNAEVIIVEFSDTECPYCKTFHKTMQRIMDEYGKDGKVAWVYRHFPIDQLHAKARKEAIATECAADQGGNSKFWDYINTVFNRTQSNDSLDPAELPKIASEIGLNVDKFNSCLNSNKYDSLINQHIQDAVRSGARGTPYSVLITSTGEKVSIEGAQPYDVIKTIIDTALASN